MEELLREIQVASRAGAYYVALFGALAVPSVCNALESANGIDTPPEYDRWFDRFVAPRYASRSGGPPTITGSQCRAFRNGMLHQGSTFHPNLGYSRVAFIPPATAGGNRFLNAVFGDLLVLDLEDFCHNMVDGATTWLAGVRGTQPFERNLEASIHLRPGGWPPMIVGAPAIT